MKKHRVTLTGDEREQLRQSLARGKADVRKLKHAQILLKADEAEGGPAWNDVRIVEALDVGLATVERLRRRFIEEGFEAALSHYRGPNRVSTRANSTASSRRTSSPWPVPNRQTGAAAGR